jgi:hypothetical protein
MRHPNRIPQLILASVLLCTVLSARATTFAVGVGSGCTHASFHDALAAALADPDGPHLIKLGNTEYLINQYEIDNPPADIRIEGGYLACSDAAPAADGYATLRANGAQRLLYMHNDNGTPRRTIALSRLVLTGGAPPGSGITNSGGALLALGNIGVHLEMTRVNANQAGDGGGIALFNITSDPGERTTLYLDADSRIDHNQAVGVVNHTGNGGGIYALGNVVVFLYDAQFDDNLARRAGGAVALDAGAVMVGSDATAFPGLGPAVLEFSGNRAGSGTFVADEGFGGAIYARNSLFAFRADAGDNRYFTLLLANEANQGGAAYAESDDLDVFVMNLENVLAINNFAHGKGGVLYASGGIEWQIDDKATAPCVFFGVERPCSWFTGNAADNDTTPGTPGGGVFYAAHPPGTSTGIVHFSRSWLEANHDPNGTAAIGIGEAGLQIAFERSVLQDNDAQAGASALLRNAGVTQVRYTTVLDNDVDRLFAIDDAGFDVQGSIFAAPGTPIWYHTGSASMRHNGCLLSHTADDIPPGAAIGAPLLDAGYAPLPRSPALDDCDNLDYDAPPDLYNRTPVDVRGRDDHFGINDLGAVEQTGILFYGGFGVRPTD